MGVSIRPLALSDALPIAEAFAQQGWQKPSSQYERYFAEQQAESREVLIAEKVGAFAGYLTIVWEPNYPPFREANIPEIVDFNVLKKFQRRGIGTALMDEAEKRIKAVSSLCGIGVGVTKDYGAAQILYAKRNYIPDGNGLTIDGTLLEYGQEVIVDDGLVFHFVKEV